VNVFGDVQEPVFWWRLWRLSDLRVERHRREQVWREKFKLLEVIRRREGENQTLGRIGRNR
jgi:hypothetical protein